MKVRKLIVRHFALDYTIKLFGRKYNAPRASRIIFPLFLLTGILNILNTGWPTPTTTILVVYFLDVLSIFFGFVYFNLWPAKWEELDDDQKWQYGQFPSIKLTKKQKNEWIDINNRKEK